RTGPAAGLRDRPGAAGRLARWPTIGPPHGHPAPAVAAGCSAAGGGRMVCLAGPSLTRDFHMTTPNPDLLSHAELLLMPEWVMLPEGPASGLAVVVSQGKFACVGSP